MTPSRKYKTDLIKFKTFLLAILILVILLLFIYNIIDIIYLSTNFIKNVLKEKTRYFIFKKLDILFLKN